MTVPSDHQLVDRWRDEPAPLLPLLHAFHERDGYLSEAAIRTVAVGLKIPIADLYGTVTFYHHLSREPGGWSAPRVCTGPVCRLRGGESVLAALRETAATPTPMPMPMPCSGRCDQPVPVLFGHETRVGASADQLVHTPSRLPAPNPAGYEECVFGGIRQPDRAMLAAYGDYAGLRVARELSAEQVIEVITASQLAGRGGAGFPTGVKWQAVHTATGGPKVIVCNADEGEPGCFKDRAVMDYDPHQLIEGMAIAAFATGATLGFIYLRYEYPETFVILQRALTEARAAGYIGPSSQGAGAGFDIHLRRGAGAYICGEEGSLLNSLEGKHPFPRNRPPYPVTHGFNDQPTAVNNVETLASVPPILRRGVDGAAWYRGLGLGDHAGTKVVSLSGDIERPGNFEVPIGLPLNTLLDDWAGGPGVGRTIQAVTMAGLSGGFLAGDDLDVTLDEPCIRSKGSFLGAAGIIVFDDTRDMVRVAHEAMQFFAAESCGKCFPCRIGTQRLAERLDERLAGDAGPGNLVDWQAEVADLASVMKATSACGLGMAAPLVVESLVRYFPAAVARQVGTRDESATSQ